MTTRNIETIVVFHHPFALAGIDEELPPGSYRIETEEERLETSAVAYRRLGTTITLPAIGRSTGFRQIVSIDPDDLAAQQLKDAATEKPAQVAPVQKTVRMSNARRLRDALGRLFFGPSNINGSSSHPRSD